MIDKLKEKLVNLNTKQKIIFGIILLGILTIGFLLLYNIYYNDSGESTEIISKENSLNENSMDENEETQTNKFGLTQTKKTVVVHVIGEVNSPGVVTLEEGSRIIDAINSAGGKTEEADLSKINLAYILEDGIQIYVPRIGENNLEELSYIKTDAGEGIVISSASQSKDDEKNTVVNINTANKEKLQTLPGVGESTANKIIEYREQNGKFQSIEDIKKVSGIGDAKFNNIKNLIKV